jgi:hypothetical protein
MSDYFTASSSTIMIPDGKDEQAKEILARIEQESGTDGYVGYEAIVEDGEVWIHGEESFDPDQAETLVRALVDELEIDEPIVVSWACSCSKPRIDEFDGGAFAVKRGRNTVWVNARDEAYRLIECARLSCQSS